jgi:hypothetical protein
MPGGVTSPLQPVGVAAGAVGPPPPHPTHSQFPGHGGGGIDRAGGRCPASHTTPRYCSGAGAAGKGRRGSRRQTPLSFPLHPPSGSTAASSHSPFPTWCPGIDPPGREILSAHAHHSTGQKTSPVDGCIPRASVLVLSQSFNHRLAFSQFATALLTPRGQR